MATPVPAPTSAPPPETGAGLVEKLSLVPASFKDKGVWYGDRGRALEMAGIPVPRSREDLADRAVGDAYSDAVSGIVLAPDFLGSFIGQPEWEEVFGFNGMEVTLAFGFGGSALGLALPSSEAYLEGDFDDNAIRQKLRELGYEKIETSGRTYFSMNDDNSWGSLMSPGGIAAGSMNRVYVSDTALVVAPATAFVTAMLATWANESPSLAEDASFSSLAIALENPLSAALFTRETILDSEPLFTDLIQYEKPEDWGAIHEWSDMGAGYGRGEEGEWWIISVFYPDPDAADADAEEILQRMWGYNSAQTELGERSLLPQQPIDQSCSELTADTRQHEGGSVLSVRCTMKEDGATALQLADLRDVGFLLP